MGAGPPPGMGTCTKGPSGPAPVQQRACLNMSKAACSETLSDSALKTQ